MALRGKRVQAHRPEEAEGCLVAAPVGVGARARERTVSVHAEAGRAQTRLHRQRSPLHDRDAPRAAQDLRAGVIGVQAELSTEPQEVGGDAVENALDGPRIGEQPIHVGRVKSRILHGARRRFDLEAPGCAVGELPEGGVPHSGNDRPTAHAGPTGMRRLAMISRMISLVPAPMPQLCTPRVQRAT